MAPSTAPRSSSKAMSAAPHEAAISRSSPESVVSISSDGGNEPNSSGTDGKVTSLESGSKTNSSTEDQDSVAVSNAKTSESEEGAGESSKKRPAESQIESEEAKKAKTTTEEGAPDKGHGKAKESKEPPKELKTVEEVKNEANKMLTARNDIIKMLKDKVAERDEKIESLETERDDLRLELTAATKKEKARLDNKKIKEIAAKAELKSIHEKLKADLKATFDKDLKDKAARIEQRAKDRIATRERQCNAALAKKEEKLEYLTEVIDTKQDRIEELTNTIKNLKTEHKEGLRALKEELKEANKMGAPRAREQLKEKDAELKSLAKGFEGFEKKRKELLSTISQQNSRINAAETHAGHCQDALNNTYIDLHKAESGLGTWKSKCIEMNKELSTIHSAHQEELKKVREEGEKRFFHVAEQSNAGIQYRRTNWDLKKQNEQNNAWREEDRKMIEALKGDNKRLQEALGKAGVGIPEGLKWKAGGERPVTGVERMRDRVAAGSSASTGGGQSGKRGGRKESMTSSTGGAS